MVHAVGCIDGHHHADAFLPDDGVGVESDPHQSEGEEREGEAPQDQDDEILDLDLTRTSDKGLAEKLHCSPVCLAAVFPVEKVNDDWHRDAQRADE